MKKHVNFRIKEKTKADDEIYGLHQFLSNQDNLASGIIDNEVSDTSFEAIPSKKFPSKDDADTFITLAEQLLSHADVVIDIVDVDIQDGISSILLGEIYSKFKEKIYGIYKKLTSSEDVKLSPVVLQAVFSEPQLVRCSFLFPTELNEKDFLDSIDNLDAAAREFIRKMSDESLKKTKDIFFEYSSKDSEWKFKDKEEHQPYMLRRMNEQEEGEKRRMSPQLTSDVDKSDNNMSNAELEQQIQSLLETIAQLQSKVDEKDSRDT